MTEFEKLNRKTNRSLTKMFLVIFALGVALVFLVNSLFSDVKSKVNLESEKYKTHLGEKFVLDKDTLTITDFSVLEEVFILSNGKKVSYSLIVK